MRYRLRDPVFYEWAKRNEVTFCWSRLRRRMPRVFPRHDEWSPRDERAAKNVIPEESHCRLGESRVELLMRPEEKNTHGRKQTAPRTSVIRRMGPPKNLSYLFLVSGKKRDHVGSVGSWITAVGVFGRMLIINGRLSHEWRRACLGLFLFLMVPEHEHGRSRCFENPQRAGRGERRLLLSCHICPVSRDFRKEPALPEKCTGYTDEILCIPRARRRERGIRRRGKKTWPAWEEMEKKIESHFLLSNSEIDVYVKRARKQYQAVGLGRSSPLHLGSEYPQRYFILGDFFPVHLSPAASSFFFYSPLPTRRRPRRLRLNISPPFLAFVERSWKRNVYEVRP
jgi:hypothetical protein